MAKDFKGRLMGEGKPTYGLYHTLLRKFTQNLWETFIMRIRTVLTKLLRLRKKEVTQEDLVKSAFIPSDEFYDLVATYWRQTHDKKTI